MKLLMSYCYCTKCESVYRCEDVKICCGSKYNLIDWAEFAFIMGYPLYPVTKKYDGFYLELYKRLDAKSMYNLRTYNPENFYYEFNVWKEIELKKKK
ncbi:MULTISPECIES: aldehyde dehydrogenase [Bacillus cereus group]|uniref:aldehyde dehydrogenase n=1 Tax=Bacillus cereus group TaxID=86661 RepID=UPI00211D597C|nr:MULTISPECIES: aldehyde dehydrogenase [Bacillus cereus group]MCU5130673.1 aldehyde dehydrogenase [Bacillus cereus]